jgi:hypothetical protein
MPHEKVDAPPADAGELRKIPGERSAGSGGSGKMLGAPAARVGERRKVPGGSFAGHFASAKKVFTPLAADSAPA